MDTHPVVIRLGHDIRDLGPSHSILQGDLIAGLGQSSGLQWRRIHVSKNWGSHGVLLLPLPAPGPHDQADQRQNNNNDGCYGGADGHSQNLAVDLALGTVVTGVASAHLATIVAIAAGAVIVANGVGTCLALASCPCWLVRPRIP